MLNELITWVLNTYLGKYLENFNPAQLSVALLSGEVELENVPIRKDALRSFGIPVEAFSGTIGKIKLQIPVRQFRTSPWCIVIERVYGVFGPKNLHEWDDEKEKLAEFEFKLAQLDTKEAEWRVEKGLQSENYYSSSYSSWLNYGTNLATNILENLELKINDVHIRYEDGITVNNSSFAFGVKINSLTVQSCDSNWAPESKIHNQNISYKLLELKDLSLYWDKMDDRNMCGHFTSKDLILHMNETCNASQHKFIIGPISATAKCKRERSREAIRTKSRPRLSCEVLIPEVIISLSDIQYNQIVDCAAGLQQISRIRAYRMQRPTCTLSQNALLWWRYAAKCHGFSYHTKEDKWLILRENLQYIRVYKRVLLNPNENISSEDKLFKLHMEKSRSLRELETLRSVCFASAYTKELNFKTRNINQGKSMLFHWFPNWWGWYGGGDANNQVQLQLQDDTYKNIEDDILNALEDTIENDSFSKRDAVFGYFTFILVDGQFLVYTENSSTGDSEFKFEMEFQNLISFVELKPRFSSYLIGLSVGSVCLKDKLTEGTPFPFLIKPQNKESSSSMSYVDSKWITTKSSHVGEAEPWFQLQYQKSPLEVQSDYRLVVKSRSLDIVYNQKAFEWLVAFFTKPLSRLSASSSSKKEKAHSNRLKFLKNWKHLLVGHMEERKSWSFEIDISAPRIIFAQNFVDKSTSIVIVDFGHFQLLKNEYHQRKPNGDGAVGADANKNDLNSEDDLFMTPCSTPPGSQTSVSESPTLRNDPINLTKLVINNETGLESALHNKLYDKYSINFTDLQVLVCKNRDGGYENFKNTSNVHLLDKFDISLQLERRVIFTSDPEYPSLTLYGTLPKIVAHVNEQKINEFLKIVHPKIFDNIFKQGNGASPSEESKPKPDDDELEQEQANFDANIIIAQFVIGQMILEVESCEKSIAELQIIGARAGVTKRSEDTHISMSVHGLLLVDAIQSYGPDFELLVASHRHVGMDSISGSLKQSEPCSPTSPASPDPMASQRPTSPHIINRAVKNLQSGHNLGLDFDEMHALIMIDINLIESTVEEDRLHVANITFNNLDIIANQETIVELLGFMRRILKTLKAYQRNNNIARNAQNSNNNAKELHSPAPQPRTEISFDFHRLNILVMRTVKLDSFYVGRKVGTLTMSEAKIHSTLRKDISVNGSLGGIQIIDITPEGVNHQRIFSVGKDPLTDPPDLHRQDLLSTLTNEMYGNYTGEYNEGNALSFAICRDKKNNITVKIRMASVWYTHCPRFIQEISMCVSQFKHYLKNFAKSLRNKASDMAKGFVHSYPDSSNFGLSAGRSLEKRTRKENISIDIVLNTPVLVLPRSSQSSDVLVANLGKITVYNTHEPAPTTDGAAKEKLNENYIIDVRNINLFSLNTAHRKELRLSALPKANEFYSCKSDAVAILHDTAMFFKVTKDIKEIKSGTEWTIQNNLMIEGRVTQLLQVSLSRAQYEQLTESLSNASKFSFDTKIIEHIDDGINAMSSTRQSEDHTTTPYKNTRTNIKFLIPILEVHLNNEHNDSLITVTFREFSVQSKQSSDGNELEVLLGSIKMEDLKCEADSKFRNMVDSSSDLKKNMNFKHEHGSSSCPNLTNLNMKKTNWSMSMPSKLDCNKDSVMLSAVKNTTSTNGAKTTNENLVIYKAKSQPNTASTGGAAAPEYTNSSIDFNCLNLTVAVDRWYMIFDFFGLVSSNVGNPQTPTSNIVAVDTNARSTDLKVSVRSLNLILVRREKELSKANISNAYFKITKDNILRAVEGSLGSITLYDLTAYGSLYREKFSTAGPEALNFLYKRLNFGSKDITDRSLDEDAMLHIQMSSVRYIHTKRFLVEFHSFIKELLQLQSPVLKHIKMKDTYQNVGTKSLQIGLEIHAASPIILLPLSYGSNKVIVADLGQFTLKNKFRLASDDEVISMKSDETLANEILDVMNVDLVNTNLFAGERISQHKPNETQNAGDYLNVGSFMILKLGSSLFKETCYLKLQIERNTDSSVSHNCPDISVQGTLSKLNGAINLEQYKVIRGFLNENLGETINDVYYNYSFNICESIDKLHAISKTFPEEKDAVWNTMSINLQLEDVSVLLAEQVPYSDESWPLASVNFIKSSLEIDSYSDGSQDIDLISSEILIVDSRRNTGSAYNNVFKHILQPMRKNDLNNVVQAEIHSRKKNGASKYTILLNNMRIMAILDCLESIKSFILEEPYTSSSITPEWQKEVLQKSKQVCNMPDEENNNSLEVVVNITDSEIIFVENINLFDTNAVILKSTTVVSFKPNNIVPISIDINHLEIFSCILGAEDESALSIIDPFTLNIELRNNCFQVSIQQQLCIRLSYNDVKLISRMLQSIPKQTKTSQMSLKNRRLDFDTIAPLIAMGFAEKDCWYAMEINKYKLNSAALWLSHQKQEPTEVTQLEVHNIVVNASCISICVIDDCMDADVPLLEISLSNLLLNQRLKNVPTDTAANGNPYYLQGQLETVIASDYYNRRLSGWEPVIEPWECSAKWKSSMKNSFKLKTLRVNITSKHLLKFNLTSTLIELCDIVRKNWTQDYYGGATTNSPYTAEGAARFRRRSPFIPFALQNLTGEPLLFQTFLTQPGGITRTEIKKHDFLSSGTPVAPNEIKPFDFGPQTKLRHLNSHKMNLHQIMVQIDGWTTIAPVSIDKVGIYFRYTSLEQHYQKRTRIVFDISLVGSAQKLITVRSALNVVNKLDRAIHLKMENRDEQKWHVETVQPSECRTIPLRLVESLIYIKPLALPTMHETPAKPVRHAARSASTANAASSALSDEVGYCLRGISWFEYTKESFEELFTCYAPNKSTFHILVDISCDKYASRDMNIAGHTITLLPPLQIKNMLCCDLLFKITGHTHGVINAAEKTNIHTVNAHESFNLGITLDNYKLSGQLKIPMGHTGIVEPKLKLIDIYNRELYLRASIQSFPGKGMEIFISAPVWLINKTGLPLIYRQDSASQIASGQFDEHEKARVVSPLLFSFSDQEGSPSLEIRLGDSYGSNNPWCKRFNIHKEIIYRELKSERSKGCYAIGINVRRGRSLYSCTTFVTLTPHFQLYNESSYKLEFAQKCDVMNTESCNKDKIISALPGCNFPFHWPNSEQEPLLCVRMVDVEFCHWSNGIPMNDVRSLYVNIRNDLGEMFFLRLEVISRGATYNLVFSDAHALPPPIRIDNFSEVPIRFSQYGCKPYWKTTVRPQSSLAYALDDPLGVESLQIEAPGGNSIDFPLNKFDVSRSLTYANFIYIAFKQTFTAPHNDNANGDIELTGQELVLGVKDKKVIIMKKCAGDRSQLWLMNSYGQLEHEGSSPPSESGRLNENIIPRMVLDLEKAPNPTEYTNLVVRPPNKQRITTQTWRFENFRLMCHANMCVQSRNGVQGLRPGFEGVLGRIATSARNIINMQQVPLEQCIEIQKFRPGSGHLDLVSKMDGPIRTIQIHDVKTKLKDVTLTPDPTWHHASIINRKVVDETKKHFLDECFINLKLLKGLGLSIVTRQPCDELAYITLENITADIFSSPFVKSVDFKVADLQVDNQLLETSCLVLLHTARYTDDESSKNAIALRAKLLSSPNENAVIFEYLTFDLKPCMVYLEERLILKTANFLGYGKYTQTDSTLDSEHDYYNFEEKSLLRNSKRYYFENLSIGPSQVRLSVITSPKLSQELADTKKSIGLTLIKFEDALIEFHKFTDKHHFETLDVYVKAVKLHYINQVKWHAAYILGSVDFLGNPLGFANDLSEGVSGLIFEWSLKSLVKNVTHGISNSTAKLTETLSDSLGRVVLDDHDNETRQKILEISTNSSSGHLAAGLKGFGFGLLGGVTSIVRHTYVGAQNDGFPGFLSGLGKGLVGTVTKPIIGVLDLASETASAVRETSRSSHRNLPYRKRLPRCVTGAPGGLLPIYSYRQSRGQQYLYLINQRNLTEKLLSYEPDLCNERDAKLRLLVSTEYVRIFSRSDEDPAIMFECHLSEVLSCHPITTNVASTSSAGKFTSTYYIEISTNLPKITRPRVRCQNEETAERAARYINYAKSVFDEREQSLATY